MPTTPRSLRVLIISADPDALRLIRRAAAGAGAQITVSRQPGESTTMAKESGAEVVCLHTGAAAPLDLDLIHPLRRMPNPPEIIITASGFDLGDAENALKHGAWEYLQLPSGPEEITRLLLRISQYRQESRGRLSPHTVRRCGIIGGSPEISLSVQQMGQAARSDANVLITGETGTGKELFAHAIHMNSKRAGGHFVIVDCTVLPEPLVESILFGHVKGAFTGAQWAQEGLVAQADGGTLFLDEVGDLPVQLQKAFLRAIQEHRFRPIGSSREISSDFRLIAATNQDIAHLSDTGRFRRDLFHRLRTIALPLSPLRHRRQDIPELAIHYCKKICGDYRLPPKSFSPEFLECLTRYDWPGNVRELINSMENAITRALDDPILFPAHLPTWLRLRARLPRSAGPPPAADDAGPDCTRGRPKLKELLETTRERYVKELLDETNGDIRTACRISGLSRSSLYEYIKRYGRRRNMRSC